MADAVYGNSIDFRLKSIARSGIREKKLLLMLIDVVGCADTNNAMKQALRMAVEYEDSDQRHAIGEALSHLENI